MLNGLIIGLVTVRFVSRTHNHHSCYHHLLSSQFHEYGACPLCGLQQREADATTWVKKRKEERFLT